MKNIATNFIAFHKPPKAIAIDLDGTLLDSNSHLSKRNVAALKKCIINDIPIIIATARTERSIRRLIGEELANRCSLVMLNGAIVRGTTPLSGFHRETIQPEITREIVNTILKIEPTVRITIELEGFEFGCNVQVDAETLWQINSATPEMVLPLEEAINRIPSKIAVNSLGKDLSAMAHVISEQFNDSISVIPSDKMKFLNILSNKASKPITLRYLLNPQGITLDNVMAFGDDIPDIEMLSECGISIAMANASPEILSIAKYHTVSNDDDGVAVVLERLFDNKLDYPKQYSGDL